MEPTTRVAKVLNKPNDAPVVRHGTVESVDGDTLQVLIDNTASPITCARACVCVQGDRVVVVGKDAIATVGANYGGGGISLLDVYPVGSIYMSVNSTDPGLLFGGTWTPIQDIFLLAAGTNYAAGATGGEATHTLTIDEIPAHKHNIFMYSSNWTDRTSDDYGNAVAYGGYASAVGTSRMHTYYNGSNTKTEAGGGQAHNNMPPYLAVYVWKRTA